MFVQSAKPPSMDGVCASPIFNIVINQSPIFDILVDTIVAIVNSTVMNIFRHAFTFFI